MSKTRQISTHGGATATPMRKAQVPGRAQHLREENPRLLNMYENQNQNEEQRPIQIRQQNVNKSLISQLDLLQSLRKDDYDVCSIQEPYIDHQGKTRANRQWVTVYPNTHQEHPDNTRSIMLINANILTRYLETGRFSAPGHHGRRNHRRIWYASHHQHL